MKWVELTLITSQEAREAAAEILYRRGASGVVVEDSELPVLADDVEDYVHGTSQISLDEVHITAYFPEGHFGPHAVESVRLELAALADFGLDPGRAEIRLGHIEEEEWATAWKQYYRPLPIGRRLLVKPSWESALDYAGRQVIELDPGMAFGTGTHATTAMCMELLEDLPVLGKRVLDLGTGSGILAVTAALLGAQSVTALDYDPVAVRVARENIALNGFADRISVQESDLFAAAFGKYDIIVANIVAGIITRALPDVGQYLAPQGVLVASGIILDKEDGVLAALLEAGLTVRDRRECDEWVALVAARDS